MASGEQPQNGPLALAVAGVLRAEIARRGMRQNQVCEAIDVSLSQLRRMLDGSRPVTVEYLARFAVLFETTPADIIADAQTRIARLRVIPEDDASYMVSNDSQTSDATTDAQSTRSNTTK